VDPDLTHLPSFCTHAKARVTCAWCKGREFDWRTAGDGGLLQVCLGCARSWGVGRFFVDPALGPRSESVWSSRGAKP